MITRLRQEPALLVSLVEAVLVVAVAFGFDLTAEQVAGLVGLATIAGGLVIRSQVTPVSSTP